MGADDGGVGLDEPVDVADGVRTGPNTHRTAPSWGALWRHSRGWHRGLTLSGAEHATYTDAESLLPQIARGLHLPAGTAEAGIGRLAPGRAVRTQRACLTAFFDRR